MICATTCKGIGMGIVYILKNKLNGKCYVGQTKKSFEKRFRQHQTSNSYIGKALRKYGSENFEKLILENIDDLNVKEVSCIQEYDSIYPNGYNLTYGGQNGKRSGKTKKRMSEAGKKRIFTEEHREHLREARKGKKPALGKTPVNKGKALLEEHRKKISQSLKGHLTSEETKMKISKSHMGLGHSDETRKKLSLSHQGPRPWRRK